MKKKAFLFISVSIAILFSFLINADVYGQEYKALEGVESIKAVFDFRKDEPKEVATYLNLIHQTFKGVNISITEDTDFVIVFTGAVVKLLSTNKEGIPIEQHEIIDNIADLITAMTKDGIRMEVCMFAVRLFGIESESILPGIEKIENGWLPLIGYQAKKYSLVALY